MPARPPVPPPEPPWPAVERLFLAALDLTPDERAAALAAEPDPGVRLAAVDLLAALDTAGGFLDGLAERPVTALLLADAAGDGALGADAEADAVSALGPGDRVGPYRLVREVGRGGMGRVLLAERADGAFEQRVALKLLRPDLGAAGGGFRRRFLRERQALARLAHPAIARLLDGGEAADGQPYFAMEYVEGEPLTDWADRRALPVEDRLHLFADVVAAVRHAHRHLVVHRDLKPSNVFVVEGEDGRPQPKLLDFGLARFLGLDEPADADDTTPGGLRTEASAVASAPLTRGGRVLTPEYAAPEQLTGGTVTTATDVYALGVVLYELLTGRRPYAFPDRSADGIARVVAEAVPERPSAVVTRPLPDGASSETVAAARGTRPSALARRLHGDLDALILKALAKDPAGRYASAEALGDDLARHLAGQPVLARPGSAAHRARLFVARHRVVVAAVALAVLALVGGLGAALWQARAAARAAARAEASRDFLVSVFEGADPDITPGDSVTARALLDAAAARVERELADEPALQIETMTLLATLYGNLAVLDRARALFAAADQRRRALPPGALADPAAALAGLGGTLAALGDFERGERCLRDALDERTQTLGPHNPVTVENAVGLANILQATGETEEAERLLDDALAVQRRALGPRDPALASTLLSVSQLRHGQGRLAEAEAAAREGLAIYRVALGPGHSDTIEAELVLANALYRQGELAEAEALCRRALAAQTRRVGPGHFYTLHALGTLGGGVAQQGRLAEAEAIYRRARAGFRQLYGAESSFVAQYTHGLALVLIEKGALDEAEALTRGALAAQVRRPRAATYAALGQVLLARGALVAADTAFRRALSAPVPVLFGPSEGDVRVDATAGRGRGRLAQGRTAEAVAFLRQAREAARGPAVNGVRRADVDLWLGQALVAAGQPAEARALLTNAVAALERFRGPRHRLTGEARRALAALTNSPARGAP